MACSFKTPFKKRTKPTYYLVDLRGKTLGRAASRIASILMGKNSPDFTKFWLMDHYVLGINCKYLALTGNKIKEIVRSHSGYIGGLRERSRENIPMTELLRMAVSKMLPKNRLRKRILKRLKLALDESLPLNIKNVVRVENL